MHIRLASLPREPFFSGAQTNAEGEDLRVIAMQPTKATLPTFNPNADTLQFLGYTCRLGMFRVRTGHIRLDLLDVTDECHVATATKGVSEIPVETGVVYVKDYSENEGILAVLTAAGIVKTTGETIPQGFCELQVCKLLIPEPPLV